jgi:ATP adenylyltransferase
MKNLWTPWRIEHVLGKTPHQKGCLFEPSGEKVHDKSILLLYRDQETIVLLNRFPYANGHLLVAPIRHIASLTELDTSETSALMTMIQQCTAILKHHLCYDGINIGCNIGESAGAGIADHLHFHLVPRWDGDHNYMTVLAAVRTIPEHIEQTYDRLLPDFKKILNRRQ